MSTSFISSPHFLRTVLRADALSCLACGLPQLILPGPMAQWLGLPQALLAYTGEFLLVHAAVGRSFRRVCRCRGLWSGCC